MKGITKYHIYRLVSKHICKQFLLSISIFLSFYWLIFLKYPFNLIDLIYVSWYALLSLILLMILNEICLRHYPPKKKYFVCNTILISNRDYQCLKFNILVISYCQRQPYWPKNIRMPHLPVIVHVLLWERDVYIGTWQNNQC